MTDRLVAVVILTALAVAGCAPHVVRTDRSLPPRVQLQLASVPRLWVAGFAVGGRSDLDLNGETVRVLTQQFRQWTSVPLVEGAPVTIRSEATFADAAYWRRLAEEHGFPLIVTGSVQLLIAPPKMVQRGRRETYVHATGREFRARLVLIDGRTGKVVASARLPARTRYGVGRFGAGMVLYYDLLQRAFPDWLQAIAAGLHQQTVRTSGR